MLDVFASWQTAVVARVCFEFPRKIEVIAHVLCTFEGTGVVSSESWVAPVSLTMQAEVEAQ